MKITIHRGQHQIGGSIIEISTNHTRLIFDVGINLNEETDIEMPYIEGLFSNGKKYDAVFISHYHSDHMGLLSHIKRGTPIYMGKTAFKIIEASSAYRNIPVNVSPTFYNDSTPITIGDMKIVPYRCDHSAYDSYMFLVEANGKKVLYTGDYRANGRQSFEALLEKLPEVDVLITEGTTLSRESNIKNIKEDLLEDIAIKELNRHSGPAFIVMSAMNIDRLKTAYNAAKATNRLFLEDLYTAGIASSIPEVNPANLENTRVFITDGNQKHYGKLNEYGRLKIGKYEISKQKYLMCVRQSMKSYLKKLNELQSFEDGILFYGMWKGYQEDKDMKSFLEFIQNLGVKIHTLHTSGHADTETVEKLIADVKPKVIMPVHTENEQWFDNYKNEINVVYQNNCIDL